MLEGNRGTGEAGGSLFPRLEPLLEQVSKPIQYVGGELNSTVKDWNCGGFAEDGRELLGRSVHVQLKLRLPALVVGQARTVCHHQ